MEVFEPQHPLLKKYIANIYFKEESDEDCSYMVFPATYTPVGISQNVDAAISQDEVAISRSGAAGYKCIMYTLLGQPFKVSYNGTPNAISINFNPGCVSAFIPSGYLNHKSTHFFSDWDAHLADLFEKVFTQPGSDRMAIVEAFLLKQFIGVNYYEPIYKAVHLLSDIDNNYSIEDIATMVGLPYKVFYRNFVKVISCSPAHFRNIARFRTSVYDGLQNRSRHRLTDISYNNNYTDQSHFIKEFRKHTGEKPKSFFRHITVMGNSKIIRKFV